jgi:hypothetical protein
MIKLKGTTTKDFVVSEAFLRRVKANMLLHIPGRHQCKAHGEPFHHDREEWTLLVFTIDDGMIDAEVNTVQDTRLCNIMVNQAY